MSRAWKPGDVRVVKAGGKVRLLRYDPAHEMPWVMDRTYDRHDYIHSNWRGDESTLHPLVTIDPENREQVDRLAQGFRDHIPTEVPYFDVTQAALREYANPTPPKPAEPTGLGAVVEDTEGEQWVRSRHEAHQWIPALRGRGLVFCAWDEIDAVKVLSEGVTA